MYECVLRLEYIYVHGTYVHECNYILMWKYRHVHACAFVFMCV